MKFEFHPEALEEYKDAARYYEGCQSGLGRRFIASVEQAILHIAEKPEQWKIMEQHVRRYLTRVFPYAVLYSIEPDYILIIAVITAIVSPATGRSEFHKVCFRQATNT